VRAADYDSVAAGYDRRYGLHGYAGVKDALLNFLSSGSPVASALEVGCGTACWLAMWSASLSRLRPPENHTSSGEARRSADGAEAAGERPLIAGVEPSREMIARARAAAPGARLVRARARTLRGKMALAGFAWSESFECDRLEALMPATEALATGVVDRAYTSQLTVLSDEEFDAGRKRIVEANAAAGRELQLIADFWLYATLGWVQRSSERLPPSLAKRASVEAFRRAA
jgi:SAM-dependent methyltransferase